jgi:ABC-type multidrug transport system ATPase subunit/ABC-type transport system involved in multi-copper enzyme maturation permease subunit
VSLEAIGLFKSYGDRHAVSGVHLLVRGGEVHGLLGPNGAGKTTLLRMFLGLVRPDAGAVHLLGRTVGTTAGGLPAGVAGFVDTPQFYPYLSGGRNLRLLARLDGGVARFRETQMIGEVLEQVGLSAHADARVGGYSAGMRQRLGLAATLLRSPKLLLLDEPTNSLDPAGARDLRAHVRRLAADGAAVLLSSHDMAEVEDLCERLTIIHHGRIIFSGTKDDLRKRVPDAAHRLRTSDDDRARRVGSEQLDVQVTAPVEGEGLEVCASEAALDRYVIALGREGVAVRNLESRDLGLESLFLRLTGEDGTSATLPRRDQHLAVDDANTRSSLPSDDPSPPVPEQTPSAAATARGVFAVVRVECSKLTAQVKVWAVLAVCLAGPFVFVVALEAQSNVPEDTLFGRWVKASGFAVPLVVLGFAASWVFPVLTSVVSGDLLSAEDRHGTWPTLLTRGRTRGEIFTGKVLTALGFSLVAVSALAVSSVAAGVLVIGRQPLLSLSGTELPPAQSLALVAAAWASILPPVFAFMGLAVLLSAATRSSAAGIGLPVLIGLVMELYSFVNGPEAVRRMMLTPPFVAWHGLFTEHPYYGPLARGTAISGVYIVGSLAAAYLLLRRRDMGG